VGEGEGEEAYPTMCTWMLVSGHGVIQLTGFPLLVGGGGGSVSDDVHLDARLWSRGVIQLTGFPLVRGTREDAYPTLCTWMFVSGHGGIQLPGFPLVGGGGEGRGGNVSDHVFMKEDELEIFYICNNCNAPALRHHTILY
jgi:hypothetical protein